MRVGHGLSLEKYPVVIQSYKDHDIHIELNPISNYIMGHTTDFSKHPGKQYINKGLRVSINSDDGSIFNDGPLWVLKNHSQYNMLSTHIIKVYPDKITNQKFNTYIM